MIKNEIFYTQRDSLPQINCKLAFSLLQSFFSSCKSVRRRHQNRYPHAEIRKTQIEAQSQWCSFYTSDLPRVQILSFSPLPAPNPEVISFNPVVLNAIYMLKMLEVTAPSWNFPRAPNIYPVKFPILSLGYLTGTRKLTWPILSHWSPLQVHCPPSLNYFNQWQDQ